MSNIYFVDDIISKKSLQCLYNNLTVNPVWDISRSSLGNSTGQFPGFTVKDNNNILNSGWTGYFNALYENINHNFFKKYNFTLPENIQRIHLGAKNNTSFTEFHCDTNDVNAFTIVGFLTPEWSKEWGGDLLVEDKKFEFIPGRFIIFKSNLRHNGLGPIKTIPYWRITLNYVVN